MGEGEETDPSKYEKTLFFGISNLQQKRHPERSASQVYRVTQLL
jgi:hypothetical protein